MSSIERGARVPILEIDQVRKEYGVGTSRHVALDSVSLEVEKGEVVCVVGPSGCGKTTLLRCVSGLMTPTSGTTRLHGELVTTPPRALGFVFQDYSRSLYPWMSVRRNVAFPLLGKVPKEQIGSRVERAVEAVGLAHAIDRRPYQLSGGMQQRVAIARALAYEPEMMMMDEPFASVDAQTREELEDLVLEMRDAFDMTILFITHDIDEAVYLADRVAVLTPSPTRVREVVDVPLGRIRDQVTTKARPDFVQLRAHVHRAVKNRWDDGERDVVTAPSTGTRG